MWFDVSAAVTRLTKDSGNVPFRMQETNVPKIAEIAEIARGQAAITKLAPLARADGLDPDAGTYLDRLQSHGPSTYGATAIALGWGATRAWLAEARLIMAGAVRYGHLGRTCPVAPDSAQQVRYPERNETNTLTRL